MTAEWKTIDSAPKGNIVQFPRPKVVSLTALKPRQMVALRFIESYIARHGAWPSFAEIGEAADVHSKMGIVRTVNQLFQAGAIQRPDTGEAAGQ